MKTLGNGTEDMEKMKKEGSMAEYRRFKDIKDYLCPICYQKVWACSWDGNGASYKPNQKCKRHPHQVMLESGTVEVMFPRERKSHS